MPNTPLNLPLQRQAFIYLRSLQSVSIDFIPDPTFEENLRVRQIKDFLGRTQDEISSKSVPSNFGS